MDLKDENKVGDDYEYDKNGNMTKDLSKNILSIQYNSLNLPDYIYTADGDRHSFLYDYDGNKLYVNVVAPDGTVKEEKHWCGDIEYVNWKLNRINLEGGYGYVSMPDGQFHFYQKDHLGNNRLVVNQNGTIEQVSHYYPYGNAFAEGLRNANNPYRYNGKELDPFTNWYDYSARFMDPTLGRFTTPDPMAEKYYNVSPYTYCMDNPVNAIDTDGGKVVLSNGSKDQLKRNFGIGAQYYLGMVSMIDTSARIILQGNGYFICRAVTGVLLKSQTV